MFKLLHYCSSNSNPLRKSLLTKFTTCKKSFKPPAVSNTNKSKDVKNLTTLISTTFGVSIGIGVYTLKNKQLVLCEAIHEKNRLQGTVEVHKTLKFDWRLFWKYIKPHLLHLLGAIIAALAVAYLNIQIPQLLGHIIDVVSKHSHEPVLAGFGDVATDNFFKDMKRPALNILLMYAGQSFFTFMYIYLLSGIGEKLATSIRVDLFKSILKQDIEFFDKHRTGELVNRLTTDVQDFKSSFKQTISLGLRAVAQLIGGATSLYIISPALSSIAFVCIPTAVIIGSYVGSLLRKKSREAQSQMERSTGVLDEAIANIRTVRSFAMENTEVDLFLCEAERARCLNEELGFGIALFQAATNLFLNGLVLGTLYAGGSMLTVNQLTAGELMAFLVASQNVQKSLAQGSMLLGSVVRGMSAGARVMEYIDIEPKVPLIGGIKIPPNKFNGNIKFDDVSFAYPTRPDNIVLKDFDLDIPAGKTVAIVGVSGSGKSTIANLIERFYEPISGSIRIDGFELKDLCPNWLRGTSVGLIEQNPTLFATTIMENIRYGKPDATDEQVIEAAMHANAHEFILGFTKGYRTMVGERGTALSGGQKQRIAIARALLKNPKILILDEATSALDTQSEAVVQRALDNAAKGRTVVVIAHRLSTVRNADVIVVMKCGKIVEIGNHDSLRKAKGHYWNLVREQESEKEEKDAKKTKREGSK